MAQETEEVQTTLASPFFEEIMRRLIGNLQRPDIGESTLRNATFEAIMQCIKFAPRVRGVRQRQCAHGADG